MGGDDMLVVDSAVSQGPLPESATASHAALLSETQAAKPLTGAAGAGRPLMRAPARMPTTVDPREHTDAAVVYNDDDTATTVTTTTAPNDLDDERDTLASTVEHGIDDGAVSADESEYLKDAQSILQELFIVAGRIKDRQGRMASMLAEQETDQQYERKLYDSLGQQIGAAAIRHKTDEAVWARAVDAAVSQTTSRWSTTLERATKGFNDQRAEQADKHEALQLKYEAALHSIVQLQNELELQRSAAAAALRQHQQHAPVAMEPTTLHEAALSPQARRSAQSTPRRESPAATPRRVADAGGAAEPATASHTPEHTLRRGVEQQLPPRSPQQHDIGATRRAPISMSEPLTARTQSITSPSARMPQQQRGQSVVEAFHDAATPSKSAARAPAGLVASPMRRENAAPSTQAQARPAGARGDTAIQRLASQLTPTVESRDIAALSAQAQCDDDESREAMPVDPSEHFPEEDDDYDFGDDGLSGGDNAAMAAMDHADPPVSTALEAVSETASNVSSQRRASGGGRRVIVTEKVRVERQMVYEDLDEDDEPTTRVVQHVEEDDEEERELEDGAVRRTVRHVEDDNVDWYADPLQQHAGDGEALLQRVSRRHAENTREYTAAIVDGEASNDDAVVTRVVTRRTREDFDEDYQELTPEEIAANGGEFNGRVAARTVHRVEDVEEELYDDQHADGDDEFGCVERVTRHVEETDEYEEAPGEFEGDAVITQKKVKYMEETEYSPDAGGELQSADGGYGGGFVTTRVTQQRTTEETRRRYGTDYDEQQYLQHRGATPTRRISPRPDSQMRSPSVDDDQAQRHEPAWQHRAREL